MDRRRARRFDLRVPVICKWNDDQDSKAEVAGFSRNISAVGVFVITPAGAPSVDRTIEIEVFLPPMSDMSPGLQLKSEGHVVRTENVGKGFGFGFACLFASSEDPDSADFFTALAR